MIDVFVYGTLQPGASNYQVCAGSVIAVRPAIANGQLYALPFGYPAMALGEGTVHGTMLLFSDASILVTLDAFEQHDPDEFHRYAPNLAIEQHQYTRTHIKTYDANHQSLGLSWSYVMTIKQIEQLGGILLPDGQWQQ